MLNDYDGSDEVLMCRALEAWDSLNSALDGREDEGTQANDLLGEIGAEDEEDKGGNENEDRKLDEDSTPANVADASGSSVAKPPAEPSQNAAPNLIDF